MRFSTLADWLDWQEQLHPEDIELGLERISLVFQQLHPHKPPFNVITVAGTNGKGSSVSMLEAILLAAGYRVGTYTSPHLLCYNERVRINGEVVGDMPLCESFERIDKARADTSLTYFEFGTLAALDIFHRQPLDVVILEVGMGGRLDAVNIIDADVALITAIDVDHEKWLGSDRETIGYEKAGIMRGNHSAVTSDLDIPQSVIKHAGDIGAKLFCLGKDYYVQRESNSWSLRNEAGVVCNALPFSSLRGEHQLNNAAGALQALQCLDSVLPVPVQAVREGLLAVNLPGRFQVIPGDVTVVYDVAHNEQATKILAQMLKEQQNNGRTLAVVGMLADKAIDRALAPLSSRVDVWCLGSLGSTPRGASADMLVHALGDTESSVNTYTDVIQAYHAAKQQAMPGDRIVIFGSFYTVAEVMLHTV